MNEAFVIIMRLKEGDLCCLIHRVYSLDGPIILIIANRCSEVILKKKKDSVPLCEKGKGLSLQASLSFKLIFSLSKDVPLP